MNRRRFLTVVAASAAVAGCGSDDGGETTPTPEQRVTPDSFFGGDADIRLRETELTVDESGERTETYVSASVVNVGAGQSGWLRLTVEWYDENGEYMDEDSERLLTLDAGQTWLARVEKNFNEDSVADYDASIEILPGPPQAPADVAVVESDLEVAEGRVTVTGRAENDTGEELSYLEAIARVFDADGNVLADGRRNETDIPDGEGWRFEVQLAFFERIEQVEDYEILLDRDV